MALGSRFITSVDIGEQAAILSMSRQKTPKKYFLIYDISIRFVNLYFFETWRQTARRGGFFTSNAAYVQKGGTPGQGVAPFFRTHGRHPPLDWRTAPP